MATTNTIYPPIIDGVLPAFAMSYDDPETQTGPRGNLVVPFSFNSVTAQVDLDGAVIKVKTVTEDVVIVQARSTKIIENEAYFDLSAKVGNDGKCLGDYFKPSAHYKIQLAFTKGGTYGWFSTVGVVKCTSQPTIKIFGGGGASPKELKSDYGNQDYPYFLGEYSQEDDINEKMYSSYFEIYEKDLDGNKIVVERSETVIHNATLDTELNAAREEWFPTVDLDTSKNYYIKFYVKTINNLSCESQPYMIIPVEAINLKIPASLIMSNDEENGVITLSFVPDDASARITGKFVITRKDVNSNEGWKVLYRFAMATEFPDGVIFRDFTVEQGKTYAYAIQQFNDAGIYTARKLFVLDENKKEEITVKFDHMYLFDGEKQLKIKFNPGVSSFKHFVSEQKVDTIGSKYPFFFRNATIGYKTFPISGLISMLIDNDELFTTYEDIERPRRDLVRTKTADSVSALYNYTETDLSWKNIESERLFKLKVLDWLNDGKPKLFRSPAEGNYLVRLMDVNLTPKNELGRMIHEFSCSAYEIDDISYNSLLANGMIHINTELNTTTQKIKTIQIGEDNVGDDFIGQFIPNNDGKGYYWISKFGQPVSRIDLRDILPGTQIKVYFSRRDYEHPQYDDFKIITIGKTGAYTVKDINPIWGLELILPINVGDGNNTVPQYFKNNTKLFEDPFKTRTVHTNIYGRYLRGTIQVYYNASAITGFDAVSGQDVDPGANTQINSETVLPTSVNNQREEMVKITSLRVYKKDVVNLYIKKIFDEESGKYVAPISLFLKTDGQKLSSEDKALFYFDRDCLFQACPSNEKYAIYNFVPNALYNLRLVRPQDLPYISEGSENKQTDPPRSSIMDSVDRKSGDLFWQNDLYFEEDKRNEEEDVFYVNETGYFYNPSTNSLLSKEEWKPSFTITKMDDSEVTVDLRDTESYYLKGLVPNKDFKTITFGNGVYADCFFQKLILDYVFTDDTSSISYNQDTANLKEKYRKVSEEGYYEFLEKYIVEKKTDEDGNSYYLSPQMDQDEYLTQGIRTSDGEIIGDLEEQRRKFIEAITNDYSEWISLEEE